MDPRKQAIVSSLLLAKELIFDENDEEEFIYAFTTNTKQANSRICIKDYVEVTVANYSLDDFKKQFRLKRGTFENLLNILQPKLVHETGRPPVDAKKKKKTAERYMVFE